MYNTGIIDEVVNLYLPAPHWRISGHFNGTQVDFNFYLPPEEKWQGRFFSYVYPSQNSTASDDRIAFALDSGAYLIQVSGTLGYRADAAAAKFSRSILDKYYQHVPDHTHGYIYGGSGGSFMTIGAIENTFGIWDGAVPIVMASPVSIPYNHAARNFASLVLGNKSSIVIDAIRADDLQSIAAKLGDVETAALKEATIMGVPVMAWENYNSLASTEFLKVLADTVKNIDPSYADDYWNKPGYLGTEDSALGRIVRGAFINFTTSIVDVTLNGNNTPVAVVLESLPGNLNAYDGVEFTLMGADGSSTFGSINGTFNNGTTMTLTQDIPPSVLGNITKGYQVRIDNRWFIALHSVYRHQIPSRSGFYGFDQFRGSDGNPIYPQRGVEVAPAVAQSSSGGATHTGNITGKIIMVDNLLDSDAFPWHADWYRSQVRESLGDRFDDNFRIWYTERADHFFDSVPENLRDFIVDYTGIYEHAMRSLVDWVEKGIQPPASTNYTVRDSQIVVPDSADERLGIQPTVELSVHGPLSDTFEKGAAINFTMRATTPVDAGKVVAVEWDFLGTGAFESVPFGEASEAVDLDAQHTYGSSGVYLCVVRVTSQREGNSTSPFALARNLGRVQVIIE
ncbi:hypothetical protein CkaCkLH20_04154 [Colletotrichum karsti]|uniref:PKD domain-containing protein n=1 Tax=Colletotrichum karsti TaxID=1095194 RepID=A0A9P6LMD8_9PEZI|nr:uncharacterized protein CkaCkLH20_04154 [Colletotrichum karsti]KAF9878116.1 hypothetical protein CkaCkLH20_04154 [Colletotrichum karsti]